MEIALALIFTRSAAAVSDVAPLATSRIMSSIKSACASRARAYLVAKSESPQEITHIGDSGSNGIAFPTFMIDEPTSLQISLSTLQDSY